MSRARGQITVFSKELERKIISTETSKRYIHVKLFPRPIQRVLNSL
jgi:hypothetical protein